MLRFGCIFGTFGIIETEVGNSKPIPYSAAFCFRIRATIAGCVITRQRPGTVKGIIFMTLEGETGTCRVVVMPDFYEKNRMVVLKEKFVQVSGEVENHDGVVHLRAHGITALSVSAAEIVSHDFH